MVDLDKTAESCSKLATDIASKLSTFCSIYLLGSHVDGTQSAASDLDLAIVLQPEGNDSISTAVDLLREGIQQTSPLPVDIVVVLEAELSRGLTPNLRKRRLLVGPDILAGCTLRAEPELNLYYMSLAMSFFLLLRTNRNRPSFSIPVTAPDPCDPYLGYTRYGTRTRRGEFQPGLNSVLKLVASITSFRLSIQKKIFPVSRAETISYYRASWPDDEWHSLVDGIFRIGTAQPSGKLPTDDAHRTMLSALVRQMPNLENDFITHVLALAPRWLPTADSKTLTQVANTLALVRNCAPNYISRVETLRKALAESLRKSEATD